ncbi:uncharacterized protein MELLADRAFT_72847 [Melampsora larici-populina 98AG31]|uniref:DUF202 domain-containing protein n=1 Tax=Melampsora larici-populina (strain 98AG31 / pathotype 3-4-7) TaxID=747676 RepID=F4RZW2_MELLP|nr:uncharacterized protein MELLADRAFT_72847 [Melampsora larici-populina 98AG31]EGG02117.1 hypothetical protein MELLADRAFT_72847 [Melampsora larici-populina 98AG31]
MLEWRARQRTFDGAYLRTSLTCSICALFILKLSSRKFDKIGLLYALLSLSLLFIIHIRRKRLNHDLSDKYLINQTSENEDEEPLQKKWGREFRTAGDIILILSLIVLVIQFSIIYIILFVQDS